MTGAVGEAGVFGGVFGIAAATAKGVARAEAVAASLPDGDAVAVAVPGADAATGAKAVPPPPPQPDRKTARRVSAAESRGHSNGVLRVM